MDREKGNFLDEKIQKKIEANAIEERNIKIVEKKNRF